jgi:hypothetical protein
VVAVVVVVVVVVVAAAAGRKNSILTKYQKHTNNKTINRKGNVPITAQ